MQIPVTIVNSGKTVSGLTAEYSVLHDGMATLAFSFYDISATVTEEHGENLSGTFKSKRDSGTYRASLRKKKSRLNDGGVSQQVCYQGEWVNDQGRRGDFSIEWVRPGFADHAAPKQPSGSSSNATGQRECVRLLHLSDTHDMQDHIEKHFPFPPADILLHTGDLTNNGAPWQLRKVNEWFGRIKHRFKHIVVIAGNHDRCNAGWCQRGDVRGILTNATVLEHEVARRVLEEYGLQIFGSPWLASKGGNPGGPGHPFHKIPSGIDVLMTHGPALNILDCINWSKYSWGSSKDINDAIYRARPRVHLFGHVHEQRGFWQRNSSGRYEGGVEFKDHQGRIFPTKDPPRDWPCDVISCNAMTSHPGHDHKKTHIAGPARLIVAERASKHAPWNFTVRKY